MTGLTGWEVERHIKHVRLLPGAIGTQDVIWVLHGVHQNHHLKAKYKNPLSVIRWLVSEPMLASERSTILSLLSIISKLNLSLLKWGLKV